MLVQEEDVAPVEQDTVDLEDIPNVLQFILPSQDIVTQSPLFSVQYNKRIFDGWVKQPSACCGASSVAGAWNALHGRHRRSDQAIDHNYVLDIYRDIMRERELKKISSFERKLGCRLDTEFWNEFSSAAADMGKEIGGRKAKAIGKKSLGAILESLVRKYVIDLDVKLEEASEDDRIWKLFQHLFEEDGTNFHGEKASETSGKLSSGKEDSPEDDVRSSVVNQAFAVNIHCSHSGSFWCGRRGRT